jgi:hypothetical protein
MPPRLSGCDRIFRRLSTNPFPRSSSIAACDPESSRPGKQRGGSTGHSGRNEPFTVGPTQASPIRRLLPLMDLFDIVILSLAGLAWLVAVGAAHHWPGADILHRVWRQIEPYLGSYVRASPATFIYAGIIFVTTWVAAGLPSSQRDALLRTQSTNLHNLRTHPVDVLFRSAFWSGSTLFLPFLVLLAVVLAPAEEWLGTFRLILVFLLGHVGATLLTAVAISHGVFSASGEEGLGRTIDVGVSYGAFCVAGVLAYRLPKRLRPPYAAALLLVFALLAFVVGRTFTDFGHFLSVLIGLASYPFTRAHSVVERARQPLYRPWLPAAAPAQAHAPADRSFTAALSTRRPRRRARSSRLGS